MATTHCSLLTHDSLLTRGDQLQLQLQLQLHLHPQVTDGLVGASATYSGDDECLARPLLVSSPSPRYTRSQPEIHTVAARGAYGCSPRYLRLQAACGGGE